MIIEVYSDPNPYFGSYHVEDILQEMIGEVEGVELTVHITFDDDLDGDRGGTIHSRDLDWCRHRGNIEVHDAEVFLSPVACTSEREVLETLCHELVHVKQYVLGELREDYSSLCFVWWTKPWTYISIPFTDVSTDAPWELEAEEQGLRLYQQYFNHV
jgi:hypothetical protein